MEERDSRYLKIDLQALPSELAEVLESGLARTEPFQTEDEGMVKVRSKRVEQRPCENRSRLIKILATALERYQVCEFKISIDQNQKGLQIKEFLFTPEYSALSRVKDSVEYFHLARKKNILPSIGKDFPYESTIKDAFDLIANVVQISAKVRVQEEVNLLGSKKAMKRALYQDMRNAFEKFVPTMTDKE